MSCTKHRSCQCHGRAAPASQSLEEVRFLKSACSAAQRNDLKRLAKLLKTMPGSINDDGVAGSPNFSLLCATFKGGCKTMCKSSTCLESLAYVLTLGMLAVQVRVAILHFTMQHEQGTKMQSPCSLMQALLAPYSASSVASQHICWQSITAQGGQVCVQGQMLTWRQEPEKPHHCTGLLTWATLLLQVSCEAHPSMLPEVYAAENCTMPDLLYAHASHRCGDPSANNGSVMRWTKYDVWCLLHYLYWMFSAPSCL